MQCDEVARLLPDVVGGEMAVDSGLQRHVESCLRCQAELARYRRILRGLHALRTHYFEPAPGLLAQTLAAIGEAGERHAVRSLLSGRRLAYVGAIGGTAMAAGAATAALLVHRARRVSRSLTTT
jgi:anti-sigma factor RsiW